MFSQHHFLVSLIDFYVTSGSVVMPSGYFREYILHLTMASRHRQAFAIPFASTSYAKLPLRVSFVSASGIIVSPSCLHRVSIGRLRTCFGSTLTFYQIRDENRAKLKISYSCGHRVSKSARYDATLRIDDVSSFTQEPKVLASSSSKEWQFYVMPGQTDLIHVPTTRTLKF